MKQKHPISPVKVLPSSSTQDLVRQKFIEGIEKYVELAQERKISNETSYVSRLQEGEFVQLYGKNMFEGPVVEYEGPLGYWRCYLTRSLRLKGIPHIDQHKTNVRGQR